MDCAALLLLPQNGRLVPITISAAYMMPLSNIQTLLLSIWCDL